MNCLPSPLSKFSLSESSLLLLGPRKIRNGFHQSAATGAAADANAEGCGLGSAGWPIKVPAADLVKGSPRSTVEAALIHCRKEESRIVSPPHRRIARALSSNRQPKGRNLAAEYVDLGNSAIAKTNAPRRGLTQFAEETSGRRNRPNVAGQGFSWR